MYTNKDRFIIIDTETANGLKDSLTYDIGFIVTDVTGKIIEQYSFIVAEIYFDFSLISGSVYGAKKRAQYDLDIESGKRTVDSFFHIWRVFCDTVKRHNVKIVLAHNARFDYNALTTTLRWLSRSFYRDFFPCDVQIWDTCKWARRALDENVEYELFCDYYGYTTAQKELRFSAEILYRFISDDHDFIESHTGLEDVLIEKEIFAYCIKVAPSYDASITTRGL